MKIFNFNNNSSSNNNYYYNKNNYNRVHHKRKRNLLLMNAKISQDQGQYNNNFKWGMILKKK